MKTGYATLLDLDISSFFVCLSLFVFKKKENVNSIFHPSV